MISPMRRCPFSENIDGRVQVSLVRGATIRARPHAVSQGDGLVDAPTRRTQLGRREPWANVLDDGACCAGDLVQDVHERSKAQEGRLSVGFANTGNCPWEGANALYLRPERRSFTPSLIMESLTHTSEMPCGSRTTRTA